MPAERTRLHKFSVAGAALAACLFSGPAKAGTPTVADDPVSFFRKQVEPVLQRNGFIRASVVLMAVLCSQPPVCDHRL